MSKFSPEHGLSPIAIQAEETENPYHAHITPIYQSTTFTFPDVHTGQDVFSKAQHGYYYSRIDNPNHHQLTMKYAIMEGIDLIRNQPEIEVDQIVAGKVFASGMAAITTAILSICKPGDKIISQSALYSHTYNFLDRVLPRYGVEVVWVEGHKPESWSSGFKKFPHPKLVILETPANPTMDIVDLRSVIQLAKLHGAWIMVDNTFATPYCQRPLSIGADLVVHSTTKYLSGHGLILGGAVISPHLDYMRVDLQNTAVLYGNTPSPFDSWQANIGLKTFGVRMAQHCRNAKDVATYLNNHPKVAKVFYPGLPDFPGYATAKSQMLDFGGMLSFELKGGYEAGEKLMNRLRLITLAVSLGNIDSLIQHPASMTHHNLTVEERANIGLTEGLVRFSVGIENIEDLLNDLEWGLSQV